MNDPDKYLREQLADQILGGNAFIKIEDVLGMVDFNQLGKQFAGLPYTFWQQFEHIRITQLDILSFSKNEDYRALEWPKDYWPKAPAPDSREQWESTKKSFFKDREAFLQWVLDQNNDLSRPFDHGEGQTLFREALLILEHNAYHTGQLLILARLTEESQAS